MVSAPVVVMPRADVYQIDYGNALNVGSDTSVLSNDFLGGDGTSASESYTVQINEATQNGSVMLRADGTFSYVANNGYKGTDVFRDCA